MTDPAQEPPTRGKWLWPAVIALLAVALLFWLLNPAGDPEDSDLAEAEAAGTAIEDADIPDSEVGAMVESADETTVTRVDDEAVRGEVLDQAVE